MTNSDNKSSDFPVTAESVANEFLELCENEGQSIDRMKLSKLVYNALGWYLAHYDKALFDELVEAWHWGPVIKSVFSYFGKGNILKGHRIKILKHTDNGSTDCEFYIPVVKNTEIKEFIKLIWDKYKHLSAVQLENASHGESEPWSIVKRSYSNLSSSPKIDHSLIKEVFKSKLKTKLTDAGNS